MDPDGRPLEVDQQLLWKICFPQIPQEVRCPLGWWLLSINGSFSMWSEAGCLWPPALLLMTSFIAWQQRTGSVASSHSFRISAEAIQSFWATKMFQSRNKLLPQVQIYSMHFKYRQCVTTREDSLTRTYADLSACKNITFLWMCMLLWTTYRL